MITGKKILITGGAGFIGSNLCDYFIERKNTIICLDNLSTGKLSNIEHLHTVYTHRRTILNAPSSSEDACAGLPVRVRRGGSCVELDGLVFLVTFLTKKKVTRNN